MVYHPKRKLLISGSSDQTARIWDLETKVERQNFRFLGDAIAIDSEGKYLFTAFWGKDAFRVFDLDSGNQIHNFNQEGLHFNNRIAVSSEGTIACGQSFGPAVLWDIKQPEQFRRLPPKPGYIAATDVSFSPDGKKMAVLQRGKLGHQIWLHEVASGKPLFGMQPTANCYGLQLSAQNWA